MESDRATSAWQSWRPRQNGRGQSVVCECCALDNKDGRSLARPARTIRAVEHGLQTILPLVQTRGLGTSARRARWRRGVIKSFARFDDCSSPPTRRGRKRGQDSQALGRSRGGFSTKIHVAVSGDGQPVKLHLTEGQRHDVTCAETLLEGLKPEFVIGDKGYDSDPLRNEIRSIGAKPVIPSRRTHRIRRHDRQRYKLRNVVERFINKIKNCRRVATRYDKLAVTFLGFVQIASILTLALNVHTT
jgi:transposase